MLVLLVTLIVTLPIMTHAVKLDMPNVTNPPPPPPHARRRSIDLEIDFDGNRGCGTNSPVTGLPQLEAYFHAGAGQGPAAGNSPASRSSRQSTTSWAKVLGGAAQRDHMKKIGFVKRG